MRRTKRPDDRRIDAIRERYAYDPETGIVTFSDRHPCVWKRGKRAGSPNSVGYLQLSLSVDGTPSWHKIHHIAWFFDRGEWPDDEVDHWNGDKLDNRSANLRCGGNGGNNQNVGLKSNNTSGHPGVYWYDRTSKWVVKIKKNSIQIHIGYFADFTAAVAAAIEARDRLHGEYSANERLGYA